MSTTLHWRPCPKNLEDADTCYDLKRAVAKRYGEHDGSCNEGPFILDRHDIQWLAGIRDGNHPESNIALGAERLIMCIQENPQGVEVWIA